MATFIAGEPTASLCYPLRLLAHAGHGRFSTTLFKKVITWLLSDPRQWWSLGTACNKPTFSNYLSFQGFPDASLHWQQLAVEQLSLQYIWQIFPFSHMNSHGSSRPCYRCQVFYTKFLTENLSVSHCMDDYSNGQFLIESLAVSDLVIKLLTRVVGLSTVP